jgi:hypothetical protein
MLFSLPEQCHADYMRLPIGQFLAMSQLSAVEAVRRPLCLLITMTCTALIMLLPFLVSHQFGEAGKLVRDSALAFQLVFGITLAGFLAGGTSTGHMHRITAETILSKPVSRGLFFLSRYAGILSIVLLFSVITTLAAAMSSCAASDFLRINWRIAGPMLAVLPGAGMCGALWNFFTRRSFTSAAFLLIFFFMLTAVAVAISICPFETFGEPAWCLAPSGLLCFMALAVFTALASTLSTRLAAAPTMAICALVFLLGIMSDYLFGRRAAEYIWADIIYRLLPNIQNFWMADALNDGGCIPWSYIVNAGGYASLFLAGLLCLGMVLTWRLDIT